MGLGGTATCRFVPEEENIFLPLSLIFCNWTRTKKNLNISKAGTGYGVCPLCPLLDFFIISSRNILFRISSGAYLKRRICPLSVLHHKELMPICKMFI
jgi:hypothetical protein